MSETVIKAYELQRVKQKEEQHALIQMIGKRMTTARLLNGFSQKKAAGLLGYANSSKLAKIEKASDTNSVPFMLISKAAVVYDVSLDYLYGLSQVWNRNSVLAQQELVKGWLFNQYDTAQFEEASRINDVFKRVTDLEQAASKSANRAIENVKTLERMIEINPGCEDELKLLAKLQRLLIETAEEAMGIDRKLKRYESR